MEDDIGNNIKKLTKKLGRPPHLKDGMGQFFDIVGGKVRRKLTFFKN